MAVPHQDLAQTLSGKIIINGGLKAALSRQHLPAINPATAQSIGQIALCDMEDVDAAVQEAQESQKAWAKLKASERGKLIHKCGEILTAHSQELAYLMAYETGKAIRTESRIELNVIADTYEFYGGLARELKGETIPYDPQMLTMTIREPIGVVGAIIPWNAPLMLMAMKVAPALVAGNTVVLKAPPEATFCVLRAAQLMNTILPKGVLNVLTGNGTTGHLLAQHPHIQKVSFTGSVESGQSVYETAAKKLIPVTLELGGKSPFIICADANLEAAAASIIEGMRFTRQGQSCSAASRLFVHESVHDTLIEKVLTRLNTLIMGDPMDEQTDIGAVISKRQYEKILSYLSHAEQDSRLTIHYGSSLPTSLALKEGFFVRPALITGITNDHRICQEEIFGPITTVIKWTNFDEALIQANETTFGLAAGVWTQDISKALQAAHRLDAGFVQVNQYIVFRPSLPFGGFKQSGLGKEASLSAMLDHYTREKTIIIHMGE